MMIKSNLVNKYRPEVRIEVVFLGSGSAIRTGPQFDRIGSDGEVSDSSTQAASNEQHNDLDRFE